MNEIKELLLEREQNINLKHYKCNITLDAIETELTLTVSDISKNSFEQREYPDSIVVKHKEKTLGVIQQGLVYVAIDSNGDGKIDTQDFSWKAIQLVKNYFGILISDPNDPYIKGIKAPKG